MTLIVCMAVFTVIVVGFCFAIALHSQTMQVERLKKSLGQTVDRLESVRGDRDFHLAEYGKLKTEQIHKLNSQQNQYEAKLHARDARVEKIIGELSEVRWTRDVRNREQYCVTIMVDPRMFGAYSSRMEREDLQYIARHIGDQVAYELASYKYIQKAN